MSPEEDPRFMHVGKAIEEHAKTVNNFCDVFTNEPFDKEKALCFVETMKDQLARLHALVEAL